MARRHAPAETASTGEQEERPEGGAEATAARRARRGLGPGWRLALGSGAGHARGFLRFWPIYDRFYGLLYPTAPIPGAPYRVFRLRIMRYTSRPIDLRDGTHVGRGDLVGELHFDNTTVNHVRGQDLLSILRMMTGDLRALAAWTQRPDFPPDLRAIWGVTILSRGAPRLGFTLRDRPLSLYTRLERFFMTGLLVLYHPRGVRRLLDGSRSPDYPREVWMSRGELIRRYGQTASGEAPAVTPVA